MEDTELFLRKAKFNAEELRQKNFECPVCISFPIDPRVCTTCEGYICGKEIDDWIRGGKKTCPRCGKDEAKFENLRRAE